MTDIYSNIDEARAIAKRLARRNKDFTIAEKRRDTCLYKYFDRIDKIGKWLREMSPPEARKMLKSKYGVKPPLKLDSGIFAIKLTHPGLHPNACSKYAAVLRLIRKKKRPGESIRKFVKANGDINGCVRKERQLRDAAKRDRG
jgi:hypothetical protein